MKTREELLNSVKYNRVIINGVDIRDLLSAPTHEQLDCPYCHEPFRSLASFRVKNGRQEVYNLRVTSFDGFSNDQLDYDAIKNYQPYGDFRKFDYCPMCGYRLKG